MGWQRGLFTNLANQIKAVIYFSSVFSLFFGDASARWNILSETLLWFSAVVFTLPAMHRSFSVWRAGSIVWPAYCLPASVLTLLCRAKVLPDNMPSVQCPVANP
ncbi:MAG: hypothetical protein GPOALKHO_001216 [Sodalis sp.]|nr:MAG: hypothetical protein GPOALKHO_001216 [Sodalis sp.]